MHEEFMAVVLAAQKGNKITTAYRVPSTPPSRRSDLGCRELDHLGCQPLPEIRRRPHAAGARSDGPLDAAIGARAGHAIYDLGCGAGNISRILAERFPQAQVIGIDSSEEMLAKARSQTADKRVTFAKATSRASSPIPRRRSSTANAAYQWVDGHIDLFSRTAEVAALGRSARHPDARNHEAPSHALMHKRQWRALGRPSSRRCGDSSRL